MSTRRTVAATLAALALAACAHGAPPYAACGGDVGCVEGTCTRLLYTRDDGSEGGGTLCTSRCARDADCPDDGLCVTLDTGSPTRFVCLARCAAAADCYAGLACSDLRFSDGIRTVCLP